MTDPNITYDKAKTIATRILDAYDSEEAINAHALGMTKADKRKARKIAHESKAAINAYDLAEAFEDLDEWLVGGGFLPTKWGGEGWGGRK